MLITSCVGVYSIFLSHFNLELITYIHDKNRIICDNIIVEKILIYVNIFLAILIITYLLNYFIRVQFFNNLL